MQVTRDPRGSFIDTIRLEVAIHLCTWVLEQA